MNIPFLNRDNNRPAAIVHDEPVFPHFSGLPMTPDPRQRRISEAAAGAAQYVIDLEGEVSRLKEELGFERNRNSLLNETNKILHEQVMQLELENRKIRDSRGRCRTKLQVSGQIVLDALAEANSWGGGEPEQEPATSPKQEPTEELPS